MRSDRTSERLRSEVGNARPAVGPRSPPGGQTPRRTKPADHPCQGSTRLVRGRQTPAVGLDSGLSRLRTQFLAFEPRSVTAARLGPRASQASSGASGRAAGVAARAGMNVTSVPRRPPLGQPRPRPAPALRPRGDECPDPASPHDDTCWRATPHSPRTAAPQSPSARRVCAAAPRPGDRRSPARLARRPARPSGPT